MKSRAACAAALLFLTVAATAQYRDALPGYRYKFPRDHFNHPVFQTEWWYYTGNVKSANGHRFGFELTFFRQGVNRDSKAVSAWTVRDLYFAHLALSDLDEGKFLHSERSNRAGPGIAGVSEAGGRIWNGNWKVAWRGDEQILQAIDERFALHFTLRSAKPPVIHGVNGVSQKAEGPGRASHYISLTRLNTADQVGWDWTSIQLQDNTELMLFRIRRKDGSIDPYSAGTFVDARGDTTHLRNEEFNLEPVGARWASPSTGGIYPVRWKLSIPRLGIVLESSTSLPSQELSSTAGSVPAYWEGAVVFAGTKGRSPIGGVGYLEMTGYDHPIKALR